MTPDINDNAAWSETDDRDIVLAVKHGSTPEAVASFLCRSGTVEDVVARARQLGHPFQLSPSSP